ncbi:MAG: SCP2 sterol-binding domain-containing protein [Solirubrobacterales bacterium]|nr:SCP2 sterol-binding domain-containing protein [Thermoleophilales bacterium]MCO5327538.1 SCP2 sterol-binding domain-containing protein [Solirubrobacterales bacterium]
MSAGPKTDLDAEPAAVFAAIKELDEDEFSELMAKPESRDRVIDALIDHLASCLRPEEAEGLDEVIHVKLWDRPGGGYDHRELVIRDGACTASAEPSEEPDLTLKVRPEDLRKIVTGEAGTKRLAFRGRLRAIGDIRLGMRLTDIFDLSS